MKPSNLNEINEAFTVQAPAFESSTYHLSKREYLDYTVRKTNPASTDTVLEVAAGTCVCGRSLAPHARYIVCLDATPAMLEIGRLEAEKDSITNITFLKGYAEELPFLDDSFDIVIISNALHIIPNPQKALSEIRRVLHADGLLIAPNFLGHRAGRKERFLAKYYHWQV